MAKSSKIIDDLFILARDKEKVARAKVVAAAVYKGKVVSYGFNQYRTSWIQRRFASNSEAHYLHAETDAIRNAMKVIDGRNLQDITLYVVRSRKIGGKNVLGNAKPCTGCHSCIKWAGIKRVYYSTDDATMERLEI